MYQEGKGASAMGYRLPATGFRKSRLRTPLRTSIARRTSDPSAAARQRLRANRVIFSEALRDGKVPLLAGNR